MSFCFTDPEEKKEVLQAVKDHKRLVTSSAMGSGGSRFLEKTKSPTGIVMLPITTIETFALPSKQSQSVPVKQANPKPANERPLSPSPSNRSQRGELVLPKKKDAPKEISDNRPISPSPTPNTEKADAKGDSPVERGRASSKNRENRGLAKSFVLPEDFSKFTKTVVDKMKIFIPTIQYTDPLSLRVMKCFAGLFPYTLEVMKQRKKACSF